MIRFARARRPAGCLFGVLLSLVEAETRRAGAEPGPTPAPASDAIADLRRRLEAGDTSLEKRDRLGFLPALLAALDVPASSQGLVFSKTSFQANLISPDRPRAIYFSDDVYVGWVPGADVIELSTPDPVLGTAFYTLDQREPRARITPQGETCHQCHAGAMTSRVPGHLVRSVHPDPLGFPVMRWGSTLVDHTTPLGSRWGGWFVTGAIEDGLHRGNRVFHEPASGDDRAPRAAPLALADRARGYPSSGSDVVALLVLEHQVLVHNRIAQASAAAREAVTYEQALRPLLHPGSDPARAAPLESTQKRLQAVVEPLLDALLFVAEAPLPAPLVAPSEFAARFAARGPRDAEGRSLRMLDLRRRLFRYPLSYLVYSPGFRSLHPLARTPILARLRDVLLGRDASPRFAHLGADERTAILAILRATAPWILDEGAR